MSTHTNNNELSPVKRALLALEEMQARLRASEERLSEPLAVVGLACRLPGGANTPEQCWEALVNGRDAISEVPRERWDIDAYYDPDPDAPGKMSTRWGGFVDDVDRFDAELFGISPREAVTMDPQQRLLLETVWEALEHAGQSPERIAGSRTGVFVGIATNDYAQILAQNTSADRIDAYFASGVAHSIASGRISYCLGLQGPSVSIDTACSSSLVAVYQACQSLRTGESDMAIAAGVNVILRPDHGITFSKSRMMAPDGRCKTFDARADGFVRAEGCGVVVLKRLADARAAGDKVLAIVRGVAINQDGASSGLTAPNGAAQESLLRAALANAKLSPQDIGYIEAHGTGTSLGDPIEVRALGNVYGPGRDPAEPLLIGSVKTNFGHLESAAGITGFIKVVLALMHRRIPPNLHFKSPNPHIAWEELPIRVVTELQEFPSKDGRCRAGVSSFGFSGTNAHIILEDAPDSSESSPECPPYVFGLSAKSEVALQQLVDRHINHLQEHPEISLGDACHTTMVGRAHLTHRLAVTANDRSSLIESLRAWVAGEANRAFYGYCSPASRPKIAFLFTGQGAQYSGMGRDLYASEPTFRSVLDRCAAAVAGELQRPLLEVMFEDTSGAIDQTCYTQPALFAFEVAMAALWREWGVEPSIVMGHSVGEYAAACVAGVLGIEDGMRLIAARARLMQSLPSGGGMMSVQGVEATDVERLIAPLSAQLAIAAFNAPSSVVIAGDVRQLQLLAPKLHQLGAMVQPLSVSHAFHSPLMEPILDEFQRIARSIEHSAPALPWISNLTGSALQWSEWQGRMDRYWRRHVREPVRFEEGIRAMASRGVDVVIEVGPHPVLCGLGCATLGSEGRRWIASSRRGGDARSDLCSAASQLYVSGARVDWQAFQGRQRRKVLLPTYPFQRLRYWVETSERPVQLPITASHALLGQRIDCPALPGTIFATRVGRAVAGAFALDHRVHGVPILPGTGFIVVAYEAATRLLRRENVELRDITFDAALPVPSEGAREVQTIARHASDSSLRIEVFSRVGEQDDWVLHATASAEANQQTQSVPDGDVIGASGTAIDPATFYADLERRGLQFGPLFQGLHDVKVSDGVARGTAILPASLHSEAREHVIHPVLLDACVQALAAVAASFAPPDAVFLPVHIERCRLMRMELPLTQCRTRANVRQVHDAGAGFEADVFVTDLEGRAVAQVMGIRLRRVERAALERLVGGRSEAFSKWFVGVAWRAEEALPSLDCKAIAAVVEPSFSIRVEESGWSRWSTIHARVNAICRAYILRALQELGWRGDEDAAHLISRAGVDPKYGRALNQLMQIVAAAPDQLLADPAAELQALTAQHPEFTAEFTFVERCGPQIAAMLTARCDPLQLLFPDGDASTAEQLYRDSPSAKLYNGIVADVVSEIVARLPKDRPLRVLEIGGGTASTTAHVLKRLPHDRTDYLFTDISPLFVARATERFASLRCVRGAVLDIEVDPVEQGVSGPFDIVIAANVLHATRDLKATFEHTRKLLGVDGVLVALEITRREPWIDISFGFTPGWWRFDDAWRTDYPLLTGDAWRMFLAEQGFDDIALLPKQMGENDPLALNTVIVARATRPVGAARRWLVIGDSDGIARELTGRLLARGDRVFHARFGLSAAENVYAIKPSDRRACARLLQVASESLGGSPDEVIHLGSIDARLQHIADVDELHANVMDVHGGLLHLAQALVAMEAPPRLWLVTRAAVPFAEQPVTPLGASVWGWARSVRLEHPELRCTSVDLDPADPAAAVETLMRTLARAGDDTESQIAWRDGRLHLARLECRVPQAEVTTGGPQKLVAKIRGSIDDLSLEPLQRRAPAADEIEIRVHAAGLNFRDVLSVLDMYPGDQGPLGSECAGQVVAVGSDVTEFAVGDEVVAIAPGALASHVVAKAALTVRRPPGLSSVEAAAIPNVFLTAQWALERLGKMKAGDRVLIHAGAGGVGLAAIALAQRAGAEVFATAGSEAKRAYLRSLGVHHVFNSRNLDFVEEVRAATHGKGVDLVLNSLSGDFIGASIATLAQGGTFLEIGRTGIWSAEQVKALRPDVVYYTIDLSKDYFESPELIREMLAALLQDLATGKLWLPPLRTFALRDSAAAFRFMAQARHIGKLVIVHPWAREQDTCVRGDRTYWITGGLSGIGLATAGWLVDQGARHLLLMGRRPPGREARELLEKWQRKGVQVITVQGDVADRTDVERARSALQEHAMPKLAGIVHSAGTLADGALASQSVQRYAEVFAAKIRGAWLLARAVRGEPLDFFVLFSSIAGLLGSAGQTNHSAANAYMDALAAQLRMEGVPAVSIQWGAWSEIGAAASDEVASRIEAKGLKAISPALGCQALGAVLREMPVEVGVADVDWAMLLAQAPESLRRYAGGLVEGKALVQRPAVPVVTMPDAQTELRAKLASAPPSARRSLLQAEIRRLALKVLSLPESHPIDHKAPLNMLGLDSLMAVELRNLLSRSTGEKLSATLLFDHPSIEALTAYLAVVLQLEPDARSSVASTPAASLDLLDRVEQMSEEELDRLLAQRMKVD